MMLFVCAAMCTVLACMSYCKCKLFVIRLLRMYTCGTALMSAAVLCRLLWKIELCVSVCVCVAVIIHSVFLLLKAR